MLVEAFATLTQPNYNVEVSVGKEANPRHDDEPDPRGQTVLLRGGHGDKWSRTAETCVQVIYIVDVVERC